MATPSPAPGPTAIPAGAAGFVCNGAFSGGSANSSSEVTDVRVGAHDDEGYDRLVIEFSGTIPGWQVGPHSPSFEASPSGQPVTLEGTGGVLIRIQPVDAWTSYRAPNHFLPRYAYLREARLLENFEAVQQWGLGIQGTPCIRVLTLDSPSRLVVDLYGG